MSKRTQTLQNQPSLSSFLKPKASKSENEMLEICSGCGEDASGSYHECFSCKKKGHTFCTFLQNPLEGFGKPILCKQCFEKNKELALFSEEQVENFTEIKRAEIPSQSSSGKLLSFYLISMFTLNVKIYPP